MIRDQNRLVGQLEPQHPPIPVSNRDLTDLVHRERARAILFERDDQTRRCAQLTEENWTMSVHSIEAIDKGPNTYGEECHRRLR